jgi:hypothetical protein
VNQPTTISHHSSLQHSGIYLNRSITLASNLQSNPPAPLVQDDLLLNAHHSSRHSSRFILVLFRQLKHALVRDGEKTAVQRFGKITVVGANGVVNGDEVGTGWEGPFHHELGEGGADGRENVSTAQHRGPDGHKVRDSMVAIADQLQ